MTGHKTHITMVCDRTGSMQSIAADAEGAVNAFIEEQKLVEGECSLWLVDFDSPMYGNEKDWFRTVYEHEYGSPTLVGLLHPFVDVMPY